MGKRNILGPDDRLGNGSMMQSLVSPVGNRMVLPQAAKANDGLGSADTGNASEGGVMGGRVFSPSGVAGMQWRPGSSFQNPNEAGQLRGRTEIAPDQREKFLQRYQQVQQHSQTNLLGMPSLAGGKQYATQQQNPLLQQQQPSAVHQPSNHQAPMSTISREADAGLTKVEELPEQQAISEGSAAESGSNSVLGKNLMQEDELKHSYTLDAPQAGVAGSLAETSQVMRDTDLSPGQPLQSNPPSGTLGVIGRRSVSDLGAIGDSITASAANPGGFHDQLYNLQMLEAAYYKLPQPKDSERAKSYTPRHPAVTPSSFPQVQAPIVNNPAFWERLGSDTYGTDTLFFTFYYQQNTYQQYLAAKELKKQSWRYHRKYNTWFQRHEEPKVATDDFEKGTYVYFDFHGNDEQHGWCQRIKTEFIFEYNFLEDELIV
ncbi:general negative regulator of transcription subunit 3-like isoform X2 [Olea europaea var. sylvestris]|uniref:general negative regulator of transcription subunit 3-like isoform X2 n=1 Tax=Olea europaea var. sylvestris TaxID=158386 RepID=UPI000C1D2680|nr:general negative regulator of transcription subunit 3-like isoform X2 [Olea europaea var. sylvestris]